MEDGIELSPGVGSGASTLAPKTTTPGVPRTTKLRAGAAGMAPGAALWLGGLRSLLGVLLALHFLRQALTVPPLLAGPGLFHPALITYASGLGSPWGSVFARSSGEGLWLWFVASALLSTLVALGLRPRLCAAGLLALSVESYWGMYPATVREDQMVNAVLLWLLLLPAGVSPRLWWLGGAPAPQSDRAHRDRRSLPRGTLVALAAQLVVLELSFLVVPQYRHGEGVSYLGGLLLVLAARWLPFQASRHLSVLLAGALHLAFYIETRLLFTSLALLSAMTVLLLVQREGQRHSQAPAMDAGVALAAVLSFLLAFCSISSALQWERAFLVSARTAADLGLAPPASTVLGREVTRLRVASVAMEGGAPLVHAFALEERPRALLGVVAAVQGEDLRELRTSVVKTYAERFCARFAGFDGSARLLAETRREQLPLAWLSCSGGRVSDLVLLRMSERA